MATHEKPADRGRRRAARFRVELGRSVHDGRVDRGLSLDDVGAAAGLSPSQVSRIERGLVPGASIEVYAVLLDVVGLELASRAYPGAGPLRDVGHLRLLDAFRMGLHRSISWASEVPLPITGDQRAWDGLIWTAEWRFGVEAETAPRDAQALIRRIQLKARDGPVDGVLLVVPITRAAKEFTDGAAAALKAAFPVPGPRALELLGVGVSPGGNALVAVRVPARRRLPTRVA